MMNPLHAAGLFATGLLTLSSAAAASSSLIECPAEIAPPAIQVQHLSGWRGFVQYPLKLTSAGMSAGPPESLAVLRGLPLNKKIEPQSTRYKFGEMGFDEGKWLDCGYGLGSDITLSKRLDDDLKECTITYARKRRQDSQAIRITCE